MAAFGSLFNNIYIVRKNSSGGGVNQMRVPLSYGPRRNFIERINQMEAGEDNERALAIKLPRMSFEIAGFDPDLSRQLPKLNQRMFIGNNVNNSSQRAKLNTGIPYTLQFELNVYAKSQDDALQIVEQILPYFNPQYTLTMFPLTELPTYKEDIPLTLTSVTPSDDYEGNLEERRTIIYTLTFDMKVSFYGPISDGPIIREVEGEIYNQEVGDADSDVLLETIVVTPTPPGVGPDSDFGFDTQIYFALDSVP